MKKNSQLRGNKKNNVKTIYKGFYTKDIFLISILKKDKIQ